jgi:hypothetical protein
MNNKIMTYLILIAGLIALLILFSCRKKSANLKYGFTKEQDTIKFQNEIVKDIDPTTFEILDENYCKDKNQVFYFRTYRESRDYFFTKKHQIQKLENADAASFLTIGYGYAKDNARAWYDGSNFKVADIPGLAALNHHFAKDNTSVYLDCKQVPGIDGSTFEIIDTYYAKDSRHYYYCNPGGDDPYSITAIPCQYESFSIIDYQYSKDNKSVYFRKKKCLRLMPPALLSLEVNIQKIITTYILMQRKYLAPIRKPLNCSKKMKIQMVKRIMPGIKKEFMSMTNILKMQTPSPSGYSMKSIPWITRVFIIK